MRAISIRPPWAWCIAHSDKRIENRSQRDGREPAICRYRGPLAIHAGKALYEDDFADAETILGRRLPDRVEAGAFIAVATAIGSVHCNRSGKPVFDFEAPRREWPRLAADVNLRWWGRGFGLILADVRPLAVPIPCRGQLNIWTPRGQAACALRGDHYRDNQDNCHECGVHLGSDA